MFHEIRQIYHEIHNDSKLIGESFNFRIIGRNTCLANILSKGIGINRPWQESLHLEKEDLSDIEYFIGLWKEYAITLPGLLDLFHIGRIIEFYPSFDPNGKIIFEDYFTFSDDKQIETVFQGYKNLKRNIEEETNRLNNQISGELKMGDKSALIERCCLKITLFDCGGKKTYLDLVMEENDKFKELINYWRNNRQKYSPINWPPPIFG